MPGPFLKSGAVAVDPVPTAGRLLWLDTKAADSWSDSASGVEATALDPAYMPVLQGDGSYLYDGSNDQLVIPSSAYNTVALGHFFVVCKTNDRTKRQTVIGKRNAVNGTLAASFDYRMGIREVTAATDGKMELSLTNTSANVIATNPVPNQEYFLAEMELTTAGVLTYRQNGVDNGSATSGIIQTNTKSVNDLYIGHVMDRSVRGFDGNIAAVIIYGRSLTAAERNQVYTYAERWVPSVTRA